MTLASPHEHTPCGPLEFLTAPELDTLHAFTTRSGGSSQGVYASLNLGLSSGDAPKKVAENRQRVLHALELDPQRVCAFHQVHGERVLTARPGWFDEEADAALTDEPGLLLVISTADCLPLLYYDPKRKAVGAAHCGWRGSALRLAGKVVHAMRERYGSDPENVRVAIGPGIRPPNYQVGREVVRAFAEAGFPDACYWPDSQDDGRFQLDLVLANRVVLEASGVKPEHIWDSGLCTYADPRRFYSHRRDRGATGRHWAVIQCPLGERPGTLSP